MCTLRKFCRDTAPIRAHTSKTKFVCNWRCGGSHNRRLLAKNGPRRDREIPFDRRPMRRFACRGILGSSLRSRCEDLRAISRSLLRPPSVVAAIMQAESAASLARFFALLANTLRFPSIVEDPPLSAPLNRQLVSGNPMWGFHFVLRQIELIHARVARLLRHKRERSARAASISPGTWSTIQ